MACHLLHCSEPGSSDALLMGFARSFVRFGCERVVSVEGFGGFGMLFQSLIRRILLQGGNIQRFSSDICWCFSGVLYLINFF
jgi:hypothetical protein